MALKGDVHLDKLLVRQGLAPHLEVGDLAVHGERGAVPVRAPRRHDVHLLRVGCVRVLHVLKVKVVRVLIIFSFFHLQVTFVKVLLPILKECNSTSLEEKNHLIS